LRLQINKEKMKVCIAEKPSVAREIATILGANTKHDGYFEGNGYAVTYTFGHLCTLKEPNDYWPHWKSWDLNNLPMLPEKFETKLVQNSGIQKQFNIIKSLFDKATVVINCGDDTSYFPAKSPKSINCNIFHNLLILTIKRFHRGLPFLRNPLPYEYLFYCFKNNTQIQP
jgi:hypothetical protein